jgi:hypothetical protein
VLTELKLSGFKSFAKQTIKFGPATLLIGANASGKSNVLDALRFVLGVVQGSPIAEVLQGRWEGGREVWSGIRGGAAEIGHRGADIVGLSGSWRVENELFIYELVVGLTPEPMLQAEQLHVNGTLLLTTHHDSMGSAVGTSAGTVRVSVKSSKSGTLPPREYPATRSLLGQIQSAAEVDPLVVPAIARFREAVRDIVFLDVRPAQMRQHVPSECDRSGRMPRTCRPCSGRCHRTQIASETSSTGRSSYAPPRSRTSCSTNPASWKRSCSSSKRRTALGSRRAASPTAPSGSSDSSPR